MRYPRPRALLAAVPDENPLTLKEKSFGLDLFSGPLECNVVFTTEGFGHSHKDCTPWLLRMYSE